jgi:hypothetical protein
MHGFLADILHRRAAWQATREKREAFTHEFYSMFQQLVLQQINTNSSSVLNEFVATFDWVRLGLFTGSRVGEYAQTSLTRVHEYSEVPFCPNAPEWQGRPIALIAEDFVFLDALGHIPPHSTLAHHKIPIQEVHIRFRFDKSSTNFSVRKFAKSNHPFLCPVLGAISIILRHQQLGSPQFEPLGSFADPKLPNKLRYLRATRIIKILRSIWVKAHPDPDSYEHQNVHRIVAHSNRVTAAVALSNAGVSIDDIAFRLRWKPASVEHYLRETHNKVDHITRSALVGALCISTKLPKSF